MMATVYEKMRATRYPVWIWGAGSMAQAVADRLQAHGIATAGYFVDVEDFRDETGGGRSYPFERWNSRGKIFQSSSVMAIRRKRNKSCKIPL